MRQRVLAENGRPSPDTCTFVVIYCVHGGWIVGGKGFAKGFCEAVCKGPRWGFSGQPLCKCPHRCGFTSRLCSLWGRFPEVSKAIEKGFLEVGRRDIAYLPIDRSETDGPRGSKP
jgi:hypothetical protein